MSTVHPSLQWFISDSWFISLWHSQVLCLHHTWFTWNMHLIKNVFYDWGIQIYTLPIAVHQHYDCVETSGNVGEWNCGAWTWGWMMMSNIIDPHPLVLCISKSGQHLRRSVWRADLWASSRQLILQIACAYALTFEKGAWAPGPAGSASDVRQQLLGNVQPS